MYTSCRILQQFLSLILHLHSITSLLNRSIPFVCVCWALAIFFHKPKIIWNLFVLHRFFFYIHSLSSYSFAVSSIVFVFTFSLLCFNHVSTFCVVSIEICCLWYYYTRKCYRGIYGLKIVYMLNLVAIDNCE